MIQNVHQREKETERLFRNKKLIAPILIHCYCCFVVGIYVLHNGVDNFVQNKQNSI